MRKIIFLVAVAVSLTFSMNAQIKMESWGAVQIGTIGQTQGLGVGRPQWIGTLDVADGARIGNITSLYHSGRYGKYGEAVTYDFDPNGGNGGLIMEQGNSESAGLYVDCEYAVIWSPGDQGYLLKVIDEDGMQLRWYINGSGYAYTNSDKNRKENIVKINGSLNKIKNLSGVTYNFVKLMRKN